MPHRCRVCRSRLLIARKAGVSSSWYILDKHSDVSCRYPARLSFRKQQGQSKIDDVNPNNASLWFNTHGADVQYSSFTPFTRMEDTMILINTWVRTAAQCAKCISSWCVETHLRISLQLFWKQVEVNQYKSKKQCTRGKRTMVRAHWLHQSTHSDKMKCS